MTPQKPSRGPIPRWSGAAAALLWCTGVPACLITEPLDLTNRQCPCGNGWVCDDVRNVCVESPSGDAPSGDAGGIPNPIAAADAGLDQDAERPLDGGPPAIISPPDGGGGPVDAPGNPVGPGSGCDEEHTGKLFCHGFEDPDLGAWQGTTTVDGSSVVRVTDPTYRGNGALRVDTGPQDSSVAVAHGALTTPSDRGDLYARGYFYVTSTFDLDVLEVLALGTANDDAEVVTTVRERDGDIHLHGFPTDSRHANTAPIPRDEWVCIEIHIRMEEGSGVLELWHNDVLVVAENNLSVIPPQPLSLVNVGALHQDGTFEPATVYVDEVVADTARIGCDTP